MPALVLSAALVLALAQQAQGLGAGGLQAANPGTYSLSADGRFLLFSTQSSFSAFDTSVVNDLYVRDLETGLTELVSRESGPNTPHGNDQSYLHPNSAISADGRVVTFFSQATNLSPDDTDTIWDVYARDRQTDTTVLVSRATGANGAKGNSYSQRSHISADGRYVAFDSWANLDPADTDTEVDVYVRDLQSNTTTLVSRAPGANGTKGNGGSTSPSLSADGTKIAFQSNATNLDGADTNSTPDVFVRNLQTNTNTLVSRASGTGSSPGGLSVGPAISDDGRYVASLLQQGTRPGRHRHGLRRLPARSADRHDGTREPRQRCVGRRWERPTPQLCLLISADGRHVAFDSNFTNLDPADTDTSIDAYMRDMQTDTTSTGRPAKRYSGAEIHEQDSLPHLSPGTGASWHSGSTPPAKWPSMCVTCRRSKRRSRAAVRPATCVRRERRRCASRSCPPSHSALRPAAPTGRHWPSRPALRPA